MSLFTESTSLSDNIAQDKETLSIAKGYIKSVIQKIGARVWANEDGYSPQQVLDQYGTDAVTLFQLSSKVVELLALAGETVTIVPDGYTYTLNEDGTVTITGTPNE